MKKNYQKPMVTVLTIETSDIIVASAGNNGLPVIPDTPIVGPGDNSTPMDDWE